jgi:hypothetical protein
MLATAFLAFKHFYTRFRLRSSDPTTKLHLIPYLLVFSTAMLVGLHGTSILKIFAILILNYLIAKSCKGSKLGPLLTWVFNVAVLFANEKNSGYRFGMFHPALQSLVSVLRLSSTRAHTYMVFRTSSRAWTLGGI